MKPADTYKLDERNHVEKPLLDQLSGLGWEIIDLTDEKQIPAYTFRVNFTEVVMTKVLREQLKVINPWLEDDQVEEVATYIIMDVPNLLSSSPQNQDVSAVGSDRRNRGLNRNVRSKL